VSVCACACVRARLLEFVLRGFGEFLTGTTGRLIIRLGIAILCRDYITRIYLNNEKFYCLFIFFFLSTGPPSPFSI
jgi:hypothetical protein